MKIKLIYIVYLLRFIFFYLTKKNIKWNSIKVGFGKNVRLRTINKGKIFFSENNFFDDNCCIEAIDGGNIIFGKNVKLNRNVSIVARKRIEIHDNVIFGPNTIIYDHDYIHETLNSKKKYNSKDIIIKKNSWIGGLVFIGKGSEIGENVIVAAGTKVTKKIANNIIFKNKL